MRKLHVVMLALVAVFAFSAVAVAAASAAEWLVKEGGVFKAVTTALTSESEATLKLTNVTGFGTITVECSGISVGTVGPAANDEVNEVLDLTKTTTNISCTVTTGSSLCGTTATAKAINLKWATKLLSTTADELLGTGAGNPGWEVTCGGGLGLKDKCTKATAVLSVANEGNEVDENFNSAEKATCENGEGKVAGLVLVLHPSGTEAVAVS
jgi:hypothetical protein